MAKSIAEGLRTKAAELINQANELEKQADELEKINARRKPLYNLADAIHKFHCRWNHTDGCGWEYENDSSYENGGTTKNRYYRMAEMFVETMSCLVEPLQKDLVVKNLIAAFEKLGQIR